MRRSLRPVWLRHAKGRRSLLIAGLTEYHLFDPGRKGAAHACDDNRGAGPVLDKSRYWFW